MHRNDLIIIGQIFFSVVWVTIDHYGFEDKKPTIKHDNYTIKMKAEKHDRKERINYSLSKDGNYVAFAVNMPVVVQAKTVEEMKIKVAAISRIWVREMQRIVDGELFEYVDQTEQNPLTKTK